MTFGMAAATDRFVRRGLAERPAIALTVGNRAIASLMRTYTLVCRHFSPPYQVWKKFRELRLTRRS
jgi:hypothetical protein